jgi:hypothetical protein
MVPPSARALAVALAAYIWRLPAADALAATGGRLGAGWPLVPGAQLWRQAAEEEGLDPHSVSTFGANVPKFPRSMVQSILALNSTKARSYNFQGSVHSMPGWPTKKERRRKWVFDFASASFGPRDFLNAVDVKPGHSPLGQFDHSEHRAATEELLGRPLGFYEVMAQSRFTLCPGGDEAWSLRVYEAVLSGSLPLIRRETDDWSPHNKWDSIGGALQAVFNLYKHVTTKELSMVGYREDWVMENRRNFIKYQTFMEGDNIPPDFERTMQWAGGQTTNAYPCGHVIFKFTTKAELEECGPCCS